MSETFTMTAGSRKRKPEDDLSDEQRFAKRFDLLNIDNAANGNKLYIPVSPSSHPASAAPNGLDSDQMALDDTKHKVYIYDLDAELASDVESDSEAKPIFIPDIEKHLNNLPKVMLYGDEAREAAKNMQMILYNVPNSLTVPPDKDNVRKAILESRAKVRERQGMTIPEVAAPRERKASLSGLEGEKEKRYNMRARSKSVSGALAVPTPPMEHFAPKATVNGYANGYDPDVMDMD